MFVKWRTAVQVAELFVSCTSADKCTFRGEAGRGEGGRENQMFIQIDDPYQALGRLPCT